MPEGPQTVVLVVLDTVRADHLSACGYTRPTSPFLAGLAARGALRCDAVAPAAWTLPSHATFFTGLAPPDHGVVALDHEGRRLARDIHVRPLAAEVETLAERYRARGFHTALVSGNPLVGAAAGLDQGFDHVDAGAVDAARQLRGPRLGRAVREALSAADPARGLFLVVNVFDAHDPWPAIPDGVGWVPPRERVAYRHNDLASTYVRFHRGELPPDERAEYLAAVTDQYDWGLRRADDQLADVFAALDAGGWLARPHRVVVTADHGELLGEHGRLRHGGNVYEGNLRVPLLWLESPGAPALEGPVSGAEVFALLDGGRRAPGPVVAYTEPATAHPVPGAWAVARYDGGGKVVTSADGAVRFELGADPGELAPLGVDVGAEDAARLRSWREAALRPVATDAADDGELLRQLGYQE